MNPGKSVTAQVEYEMDIVSGPMSFTIRGVDYELSDTEDIAVLKRVTTSGGSIIDSKVVGVIGGRWRTDPHETLNLFEFLNGGGGHWTE